MTESSRPPHFRRMCATTAAVLLATLGASGPAHAQLKDEPGSKDHPIISRYEASVILAQEIRKFEEFLLPLGPAKFQVQPTVYLLSKSEKLEGRLTRTLYTSPPERSTLEVMRNYEQELKKGGFQTLYTCSSAECGIAGGLVRVLYPQPFKGRDTAFAFALPQDLRYLCAKRANSDGTTHVSLLLARQGNAASAATFGRVTVLLDVIESAVMDSGLVKLDAGAMAKEIAATGHVALYGILFDTNKADVKEESQPALQEIAKLLSQNPALKLLVVGHTDNVGGFDTNMALSERRAAAVLKELTTKYAVAATRLRPVGVGMAAPVAPNDSDAGRAKNRRVELVPQ